MRWHDDGFVQDLRKSGSNRVVVSGATLEKDDVVDLASADDAVQVIERDGVGESSGEIADFSALQKLSGDIALHEDGATFAEAGRAFRGESKLREFAFDRDAEFLCLFFEERSGTGGAGFVHGEIDDDT